MFWAKDRQLGITIPTALPTAPTKYLAGHLALCRVLPNHQPVRREQGRRLQRGQRHLSQVRGIGRIEEKDVSLQAHRQSVQGLRQCSCYHRCPICRPTPLDIRAQRQPRTAVALDKVNALGTVTQRF
jgi:hypothetical protein